MRLLHARPAPRAWGGMAIALALAALALWSLPRDALDWQPARATAEPWRLWTAALVHLSALHLSANLLGCAVVAAFGIVAGVPREATWAWLSAWPITHAALVVQPQLLHYGGLSGLLHAGVAIAALYVASDGPRRHRGVGLAVLAGLALKLWLEQAWLGGAREVPGWDIRIAPFAHLTGALSGLVCGGAALWLQHRRTAAVR